MRECVLPAVLVLLATAATAQSRVFTGVVRSTDAEPIQVPMSTTSPTILRYVAPDGGRVKPGDVLVRIDPGPALARIRELESELALAKARAEKDLADLEVLRLDAELAWLDAQMALAKAEVDAAIPAEHLARLDYDRYQGERERATREQALKQRERDAAVAAVARRREDARLEQDKIQADLRFAREQVTQAEQRATRAGIAVFGFNPWNGQRYEEGASANVGAQIGEVVGEGELAVRGWVLGPDRPGLAVGQAVRVQFDALPGRPQAGRIAAIAGAPEPKAEWGSGRYFSVDVRLDTPDALPLRPGMSARVQVLADAATPTGAAP